MNKNNLRKSVKQKVKNKTTMRAKKGPQSKRQSLAEVIKQQSKLHNKYKEYSEKTTEELKEMYPILGGGYRQVCSTILSERYLDEQYKKLKSNQTEELTEGEV